MRWALVLLITFHVWLPLTAAANVASMEVESYSVYFAPGFGSAGNTIYFTTYDNSGAYPLVTPSGTVSGEFRPFSTLGGTQYVADYLLTDSIGVYEYGAVLVDLDASDGDGNGMLDPLERANAGTMTLSGIAYPDVNAFGLYDSSSVLGSVSRSPEQILGSYFGSASNIYGSINYSGQFEIANWRGFVEYQLDGSTQVLFGGVRDNPDGSTTDLVGFAELTVLNTNQIQLGSILIYDARYGQFFTVYQTVLSRTGNRFIGTLSVSDGDLSTGWPDFLDWRIEVIDPSDVNNDGLPDILLVPEPSLLALLIFGVPGVAGLAVIRRRT